MGYLVPFTCHAFTLQAGMGVGAVYGIRAALGVARTAAASRFLLKELLN